MCLINFSSSLDFVRMFPDGNKNNTDQVEKIYVFLDNINKSWKTLGPSSVNTFSSKPSSDRPTHKTKAEILYLGRRRRKEKVESPFVDQEQLLPLVHLTDRLTHAALIRTSVR